MVHLVSRATLRVPFAADGKPVVRRPLQIGDVEDAC